MPKSSFLNPTLSALAERYFSSRFGSSDETLEGIDDLFDQDRCRARIAYEHEDARIRRAYVLKSFGSPTGEPSHLPQITRELAREYVRNQNSAMAESYRAAIRFPTILRAEGFEKLLSPFSDGPHSSQTEIIPVPGPVELSQPPAGWSVENATEKFCAMNPYRQKFLAALHGAPDERAVPPETQEEFREHVQYHNEAMQKWFEEIAADSLTSIDPTDQANALRLLESESDGFANCCRYELELQRIEMREARIKAQREE